MLNTYYRIKENYVSVAIDHQYTIMSSENDSVILQAPLALKLLGAIRNSLFTKEDLLANYLKYSPNLSDILITLQQLETEGYITSAPLFFSQEQTAYWEELGYATKKLASVFQNKKINVIGIGDVEDSLLLTFSESCTNTGLQLEVDTPFITVVLTNSYSHPDLEVLNAQMLARKQAWLLIKLNGTSPYVGPLLAPENNESACWKCLEHRLKLHDQENKLYQALAKTDTNIARPLIHHPIAQQWGMSIAVLELVSWLYHSKNETIDSNLIVIDSKTGERGVHKVTKRPQCEACGNAQLLQEHPKPIILQPQSTIQNNPGSYRTVTPEETLEKYKSHISSITGVVPYLKAYHPVDDVPIFNYGSGKNMALHSASLFWLNLHLRSANGGKGKTETQAKTGALCEAIERYSLMYQGKTHTISASFSELTDAIHPNACMLYSNHQYTRRDEINAISTKFYSLIPIDFDETDRIDWSPVYNITKEKFEYLPSCYCYAQYPAEDENNLYSYPDSNGCAAGNTIEEAILQGFLELVERDAAAIWWYNRLQYPSVNLASANNPYIDQMTSYYASINRSLYVLDLTTDFNIPVFVSISHSLEGEKDQIIYAFGAHLDVQIALERAIVELNQILPVVIKNKGSYLTTDKTFVDWLDTATLKNNEYLVPQGTPKNMQTDYPKLCEATLYDSVQFCINSAKNIGLDTLVVDLTQPDIGLSVAKVIVPGTRHFWRRTAPGRLYDVPVKMGKIQKPYTEAELNPLSIFI